jgi:AcrR family transcriptional regulator
MEQMTFKTVNKHELRTRETRALLLQAAETIFVRDGYEGAELGEIAALAGRTKGSIYAQFQSKEDIFLALIEDRAQKSREQLMALTAGTKSVARNIAALRTFYTERLENPAWSLLLLEYKLFAMRHPDSMNRLRDKYAAVFSEREKEAFTETFGTAKGKDGISRLMEIQSLQPVVSALVLEAQLGTALSDKDVLQKVFTRIFDALLA